MSKLSVVRCSGDDAMAEQALAHLRGPRVAISGGTTFARVFPRWGVCSDLRELSFFPVDERRVPPGDAASNWDQARRLLLEPLGKSADLDHFAADAASYQAVLERELGSALCFDSIFLGMGDDGHTASLFPGTAALEDEASPVLETLSPKPPFARVTLGLRVLWACERLVAVVAGVEKRPMVARLLACDRELPITRALEGHPAPILILERSADPEYAG